MAVDDTLIVLLICGAVLTASVAQRLTGMGFALVAGPFLVLLLDPLSGVVFVNVCGVLSSVLVLARTYRYVDWRLVRMFSIAAIAGTVPGAVIAVLLPARILETVIGMLVVVALAGSLVLGRMMPRSLPRRRMVTSTFGFMSGTMNAAAGIGGPALSAFAVLTRWNQFVFAATIQPVFILMGVSAIASKVMLDSDAWPNLSWGIWAIVLGTLVAGMLGGEWLTRFVSVKFASIAMLILAFLGGFLTIGRGTGLL